MFIETSCANFLFIFLHNLNFLFTFAAENKKWRYDSNSIERRDIAKSGYFGRR